jgi:hypothetical protein
VETLSIASHTVRRIGSIDPYANRPSGLGRLLAAIAIIGLVFIGLESAAGAGSTGSGLHQTAFAAPELLP